MSDLHVFPLRLWPGLDPEQEAVALLDAGQIDGTVRNARLSEVQAQVRARMARAGIPADVAMRALSAWTDEVLGAEQAEL